MSKIPVYENVDICAKCGGSCCRHMACHFAPSDFPEISFEFLKSEIEKGCISIDWWESDTHQYYLRMRHVDAPVVDPSWGGKCVLLTNTGCSLPFEKRPLGARSLEPNEGGLCVVHYSKEQCKDEWQEHKDILEQLVEYFKEGESK